MLCLNSYCGKDVEHVCTATRQCKNVTARNYHFLLKTLMDSELSARCRSEAD